MRDGCYELSTMQVKRPHDWSALEMAYSENSVISGVVSGLIRGGLSVDLGVRAFLPASRSGTRDAAELEALAGQEIRCKIIQLDTAKEDVVADRRVLLHVELPGSRAKSFLEEKE